MIKNPIKRQNLNAELPCGNAALEITENQGLDVTGGTFSDGTISITLSAYMGNKGKVCTWTCECQNNCRD